MSVTMKIFGPWAAQMPIASQRMTRPCTIRMCSTPVRASYSIRTAKLKFKTLALPRAGSAELEPGTGNLLVRVDDGGGDKRGGARIAEAEVHGFDARSAFGLLRG